MTKPKPRPDSETLAIIRRYGWYIDHAFQFRKREIDKQLNSARESLELPIPDNYPDEFRPLEERNRKGLASMISELEFIQREFDQAHAALIARDIK